MSASGIWRLAGFLIVAFVGWTGQVLAGPYDVAGVAVQASADNAVAAKEKALADGQARSLQIVLRRLTLAADYDRLPQVGPETAVTLIAFFGVDKEFTGPTTYNATLSFRYDPRAVQQLLSANGIPFTDEQATPTLVVPVFRQGEEFMFQEKNPNLEAWRTFDLENTLTPIRLPQADVAENGIDPNAVLARDSDTMSMLRYLYRVDNVLISLCETDQNHTFFKCTLEGTGPVGAMSIAEEFAGGSDPFAVAQAAVGSFLAQIEDQWKERNIARRGPVAGLRAGIPVPVAVSFSGIAQWQSIRSRLESVPGVSDVEIKTLNARGALLSVYYSGSEDQLAAAAAGAGLQMDSAGDHWVLTAN